MMADFMQQISEKGLKELYWMKERLDANIKQREEIAKTMEDNWNLADEMNKGNTWFDFQTIVKTFIQKVKEKRDAKEEELKKRLNKPANDIDTANIQGWINGMDKIIDEMNKLAGEL